MTAKLWNYNSLSLTKLHALTVISLYRKNMAAGMETLVQIESQSQIQYLNNY